MISLDMTFFVQMVNFLFIFLLLNFILFRPIRRAIEERKRKFKGLEGEIGSLSEDIQKRLEEWQAGLDGARRAGLEKREEIKKGGLEEEKGVIQQVRGEVDEKIKGVRAKMAKDTEEARGKLRGQIESFSREVAEKILGRSIS